MLDKTLLVAALPMVLAELPSSPPPGLGGWLLNLLYVVGIFFFLIKGISESRTFFGRKPTLDETLAGKADGKAIDEVKLNIAGLVSRPAFDEYTADERRRDTGLEKQISEARHTAKEDDQAILSQVEEQYALLAASIAKIETHMATGFEHVEEKRSANIGVIHRDLKEAEKQISAIRADTESHTRALAAQDLKIDRILERLPRRNS